MDSKTEDLERLMSIPNGVNLTLSSPDMKPWPLSPFNLFLVKSFFLTSFNHLTLVFFSLANFIWESKAWPKVKAFASIAANKKVNTNDLL